MARKRYKPEDVAAKLRQVDVLNRMKIKREHGRPTKRKNADIHDDGVRMQREEGLTLDQTVKALADKCDEKEEAVRKLLTRSDHEIVVLRDR